MQKDYHILNGDALKQQFPGEISGEVIVARECLVDGEVKSDTLEELFKVRSAFIAAAYGLDSKVDYYRTTVSEFDKINSIPRQSTINCWFEDDLFCQVNFWFVAHLIFRFAQDGDVYLIRPSLHTPYGFGGMKQSALIEAYKQRVQISELDKIAGLWKSYQEDDRAQLISTAKELRTSFPFILRAVEAHMARIPRGNDPGRPVQALMEIVKELDTEDFTTVFREFNRREAIYGFGDLQVRRLFDDIKNNR